MSHAHLSEVEFFGFKLYFIDDRLWTWELIIKINTIKYTM